MDRPLVLASRSPRRREILARAGIACEVGPFPDLDEAAPPGLDPPAVAEALARAKVEAVVSACPGRLVLAADTVVYVGASILGKPRDANEARRTLRRLAGTTHEVATGVALAEADRLRSGVSVAKVRFRPLSETEIEAYVLTGEPFGRAGAYGLEGGAAAFLDRLDGDRDTVVGLPLRLVFRLLAAFEAGAEAPGPVPEGR